MERKINWISGYLDEIELVYDKAEENAEIAELLSDYVVKPPGKLALVPESDPRPPVELDYTPDQEFSVLPDDEE